MDSRRDESRMVRFKDSTQSPRPNHRGSSHFDTCTSKEVNATLRQDTKGQDSRYYHPTSTEPHLPFSTQRSRNKLDHLMSIRRYIVESLNQISTDKKESHFPIQPNRYDEARQCLYEHYRVKELFERMDLNPTVSTQNSNIRRHHDFHRYNTIGDLPRRRVRDDHLFKLIHEDDASLQQHKYTSPHSNNKPSGNYRATNTSTTGDFPDNSENDEVIDSTYISRANGYSPDTTTHSSKTPKSEIFDGGKQFPTSRLLDYNSYNDHAFLERSWPRRKPIDYRSDVNDDLIGYLDAIEANTAANHRLANPNKTSPEFNTDTMFFGSPCFDTMTKRSTESHVHEPDPNQVINLRRLPSSESFKSALKPKYAVALKRRSSFNRDYNPFYSQNISSPKRDISPFSSQLPSPSPRQSITRESFDGNSSSMFSSEADSEFLFYPCSQIPHGTSIPSLTPSFHCSELLASQQDDPGLLPKSREDSESYYYEESFDDRLFYYDDDALSDEVFMDSVHLPISKDKDDMEYWHQAKSRKQDVEMYANNLPSYYNSNNNCIENGRFYRDDYYNCQKNDNNRFRDDFIDIYPQTKVDKILDKDDTSVEFNNITDHCENDDATNDRSKMNTVNEVLCYEVHGNGSNLATAFDSLRRNSSQTKSRQLWKERRAKMKKSPGKQDRPLTPRFDRHESYDFDTQAENEMNTKCHPHQFILNNYDQEVNPPRGTENLLDNTTNKKPLRGILKNMLKPHIQDEHVLNIQYADCNPTENSESSIIDATSPNVVNNSFDIGEAVKENLALSIVAELNTRESSPLNESFNIPHKVYVSVGTQVNFLELPAIASECEGQPEHNGTSEITHVSERHSNNDISTVKEITPTEFYSIDDYSNKFPMRDPCYENSKLFDNSLTHHCGTMQEHNTEFYEPNNTTETFVYDSQDHNADMYPFVHVTQADISTYPREDFERDLITFQQPAEKVVPNSSDENLIKCSTGEDNKYSTINGNVVTEDAHKNHYPGYRGDSKSCRTENNVYPSKDDSECCFSETIDCNSSTSDLTIFSKSDDQDIPETTENKIVCSNNKDSDRCATNEILLSKDNHEFHYLLSPTETGTTETIAVRKNSLEVYKWTRSWQKRAKYQRKRPKTRSTKVEDSSAETDEHI